MLFSNFAAFAPLALALGAHAVVLPIIEERCSTCPTGTGAWTGITSSAEVQVALQAYTAVELGYVSTVADVFTGVSTNVATTVSGVLSVGTGLYGWDSADLTSLCGSLDAYAAGTLTTSVALFATAGIDVNSWTTTQASCLSAFVKTCVDADVSLGVSTQTSIVATVHDSIVVASYTAASLKSQVSIYVSALTSVAASLNLAADTATCVSAGAAIKVAIKAYIATCIKSSTGLLAIVTQATLALLEIIANAWVSADLNTLTSSAAGLLGINLSSSTDATICKSMVAFLLKLNSKFDVVTYLKLDASIYTNVFAGGSVVAN